MTQVLPSRNEAIRSAVAYSGKTGLTKKSSATRFHEFAGDVARTRFVLRIGRMDYPIPQAQMTEMAKRLAARGAVGLVSVNAIIPTDRAMWNARRAGRPMVVSQAWMGFLRMLAFGERQQQSRENWRAA